MVSIDVDFDVFKELTVRRKTEAMTENEVLREVLGMPNSTPISTGSAQDGTPWVTKGVSFPHGTQFRAVYKGQQFTAAVQNGALVLNGERYTSPSAAAISITGNSVNGWQFWECLQPGAGEWKPISAYKRKG